MFKSNFVTSVFCLLGGLDTLLRNTRPPDFLSVYKVDNGNDHADDDNRPAERGGFDSAGESAAQRPADQRADRHDDCHRPDNFP